MEAFVWDQRFVTGIDSVDQQHRHLFDIVNRVGDMLLNTAETDEAGIQAVFKELADYARYHFADEEKVMREGQVDARSREVHLRIHREFIQQVGSMWSARTSMNNPAEILHGFLTAWLSFHILGEDQSMARQIMRMRQGETAANAFAAEKAGVDSSTTALLTALQKLYQVLSMQNRDLAQSNTRLEEKVAERTTELGAANVRLQAEQAELKALLRKVEQTQSQLLQSEKMASIGQLAAGVAHEINNPIGFVNSNLGTLKTYSGRMLTLLDACKAGTATEATFKAADFEFLRSDTEDLIRESQDGLDRVKKIVSDLKDFSRVDQAEWQEADLNAGLESTLNVVWNEVKYKAEVVKHLGKLPAVRCIPAQINQVFMNLIANAAQAIEQRGVITLSSGTDGATAWVDVADTGSGMSPEVQRRIFEPFYTTKAVGKGTGLGLSLSYDIVNKHGGRITVDSEPGKGSTFRVSLPIDGIATARQEGDHEQRAVQ